MSAALPENLLAVPRYHIYANGGGDMIDWSSIREKVAIGVVTACVTAVVLGGLTLLWNWGSSGGLIHALGGLQVEDIKLQVVPGEPGSMSSQNEDGIVIGRVSQRECPEGTILINAYCASGTKGNLQHTGLSKDGFFCEWNSVANPESFNGQAQPMCLKIVKK
jgi:hypothetical protein